MFCREHGQDGFGTFRVELNFVDVFEDLLEVGLHSRRLFGLAEDFQQLVIAQEEEPSELLALLLKVAVELFLNEVQQRIVVPNVLKLVLRLADLLDVAQFARLVEQSLPESINPLELLAFVRQLFGYIGRVEDRLEVHPIDL